jgi:hypothetical protein
MERGLTDKTVLTSAASSATAVSTSTIATTAAATISGHLDQAGVNLLLCLSENRNKVTSLLLI